MKELSIEEKIKYTVRNIDKKKFKEEFFRALEQLSLKVVLEKDLEEVVAFLLASAVAFKEKYHLNEEKILEILKERIQ